MRKRVVDAQLSGYNNGYNDGFRAGYDDGFNRGRQVGISQEPFEGTSIIIPTYNQVNYLRECIASIRQYTPQAYELIIIDNGSDDGTAEFLKSLYGIRYKILPDNAGFAGAVNEGLMLARGTTLLILNNDSVVTTNWLSNLMNCLLSHYSIGIVGPVTNYISGDQQIATDYANMEEMQQFAEAFNQTNASRWSITNRLTGFCMLLRRETFLALGYFDEGFEIGNCEDDDYGLRARLLGVQLIIAKDTFIHHYGSVSMKALDTRFEQVYGNNLMFYSQKWSDPHGYLTLDWRVGMEGIVHRTIEFYPTCIIVQGVGANKYWIDNGSRHTISGECHLQAVRVSQVDLHQWSLGEAITVEELQQRIQQLEFPALENTYKEGTLIHVHDGGMYQCVRGMLHRFINTQAITAWGIDMYHTIHIGRDSADVSECPPIICPPVIKSDHI
jgi:GT2 family glycosyltransferase